jgi:hypothetical protein
MCGIKKTVVPLIPALPLIPKEGMSGAPAGIPTEGMSGATRSQLAVPQLRPSCGLTWDHPGLEPRQTRGTHSFLVESSAW